MNRLACEVEEARQAGIDEAVHCALCGMRFLPERSVCAACPLSSACDVARCPHCGYQFPRGSRIVDWIRRRFSRGRS